MRDDHEIRLVRSYNEFMREWEREPISGMPVPVVPATMQKTFEVRKEKAKRRREGKARGNSHRLKNH